jgi:hypothetical protein
MEILTPTTSILRPNDGRMEPDFDQLQATVYLLPPFDLRLSV